MNKFSPSLLDVILYTYSDVIVIVKSEKIKVNAIENSKVF